MLLLERADVLNFKTEETGREYNITETKMTLSRTLMESFQSWTVLKISVRGQNYLTDMIADEKGVSWCEAEKIVG